MNKLNPYTIKFVDPVWIRTNPDGSWQSHPTLQSAIDVARNMAIKNGHDVIWYDREGNEQGHWRGWKNH